MSARVSASPRHWPDLVGLRAAGLATEIAREHGVGLVACPKPNIVGAMLGPIQDAGLLGVTLVQNAPLMGRPFSEGNTVGNNPLAVCALGDPPFLFDGALSQFSLATPVREAERAGAVPKGALLNALGRPITDAAVLDALGQRERDQGGLAPLGGFKGLGLAVGLEMLTGGFHGPPSGKPWGDEALIVALGPRLFEVPSMA